MLWLKMFSSFKFIKPAGAFWASLPKLALISQTVIFLLKKHEHNRLFLIVEFDTYKHNPTAITKT